MEYTAIYHSERQRGFHHTMRRNVLIILPLLFGVILAGSRVLLTGEIRFTFLVWNMFLAAVPVVLGRIALRRERRGDSFITILPFLLLWLLFLPNGPYIVTDFLHLGRPDVRLAYDFVLIATCAIAGLVCTFHSLRDVEEILERRIGARPGAMISLTVLLLCSYGIYLGRFIRLNSWDAILFPLPVARMVGEDLLFPSENLLAWKFTIIMTGFLWIVYAFVRMRPDREVWQLIAEGIPQNRRSR